MTVTISYNVSNEVNFQGVGFTVDPLSTLPGIYGNVEWSFDLTFSGTSGENQDPILIDSIVASVPEYVSVSYPSSDVVRMSKATGENIFPGEKYRFVRFETQELFEYEDVSSIEDGLSVIGWDTPSQEEVNPTYSFLISYTVPQTQSSGETTFSLSQTLYWNFAPGWAKLQQLVQESDS